MVCLSFRIPFFCSPQEWQVVFWRRWRFFLACCFFLSFYKQCFLWRKSYKPLIFQPFQGESRARAREEKRCAFSIITVLPHSIWTVTELGLVSLTYGNEAQRVMALNLQCSFSRGTFLIQFPEPRQFGYSLLCPNLGMSRWGHVRFLITRPILINSHQFVLFSCLSSDNHVRTEPERLQKILLFCIHLEHL